MNGVVGINLNNAFNIGGRIQILKQNTEPNHFEGNRLAFLLAVHALHVETNDNQLIPVILQIINGITNGDQDQKDNLVRFANTVIEDTFQVNREILDIEEMQGQCGDNGGGCGNCPANAVCHQ